MTTTAPPPATADPAEHSATPSAAAPHAGLRAHWRRRRWWLLATLALVLVGALVAGIPTSSEAGPLDPRSGAPDGTRAVDQLLQHRYGVTSRTATTESELAAALRADDTTVVLTFPEELTDQEITRLAAVPRGADSRLVLFAPGRHTLDAFAPGISTASYDPDSTVLDPACALPEAATAGTARIGGQTYYTGARDLGCYPRAGGRHGLISRTAGKQQLIVIGGPRLLTNERLDQDGNAALGLGLLGAHHQLVWQLSDHTVPTADAPHDKSLGDLIPSGWHWASLQLVLAALLAVVWRARRLGPVLSERLPAVVRASETTEGRARLYHRANARGHAAETLRRAARRRAAAALGLPHTSGDPDPAVLTEAAAARLGRPSADLQQLLYGPAPSDDAALLRLADDLDDMEWQVRQP